MEEIDKRYQTLLILWFAMLMNIGILFLIAFVAAPDRNSSPSSLLTLAVAGLGAFLVLISFVVKRKFFARAVDQQDLGLVQKGLIVALAICEVSAIIGLIERFVIGNRDYFLLFLLAAAGIALHFPKRDDLRSACYRVTSGGQPKFE